MDIAIIARVCHEANRAYSEGMNLELHMPWDSAPQWQKDSAIAGVKAIFDDPLTMPYESHERWMAAKVADGWVYGKTKDAVAKTHPCMVPYGELPDAQRVKDTLFVNIVRALMPRGMLDDAIETEQQRTWADAREAQRVLEPRGDYGHGQMGQAIGTAGMSLGSTQQGQIVGDALGDAQQGVAGKPIDFGETLTTEAAAAKIEATRLKDEADKAEAAKVAQEKAAGASETGKETNDGKGKPEEQPEGGTTEAHRDGRKPKGGKGA